MAFEEYSFRYRVSKDNTLIVDKWTNDYHNEVYPRRSDIVSRWCRVYINILLKTIHERFTYISSLGWSEKSYLRPSEIVSYVLLISFMDE